MPGAAGCTSSKLAGIHRIGRKQPQASSSLAEADLPNELPFAMAYKR